MSKPVDNIFQRSTNTIHVGEAPKSISFSGCGFLGVYHIGVASCLKTHASGLLDSIERVYGCSAGSMIGAMLFMDVSFGEVCQHTMDIVTQARSNFLGPLSPRFKLNEILLTNLREKLPEDAHVRATGKLYISLTRVRDGQNVIISDYASREELIQVLLCSCFVPFYSGLVPPTYRGVYYIDGGLSNNLPADNETITVSPWSGSSDICPKDEDGVSLIDLSVVNTSIQATPSNLYRCSRMFFPPHPKMLRDFCAQGYQETAQYLREHGLFETKSTLRKNLSFSVGLNQMEQRREMTRHMSTEGNLANFVSQQQQEEQQQRRRRKFMSESSALAYRKDSVSDLYDESINFDVDTFEDEEFDEDQEEDGSIDGTHGGLNVLTVIHVYPIEIQKQLLKLHMILPQPVLDALEQTFKLGGSTERSKPKQLMNQLATRCRQSLPLDRSYQLAVSLLNCLGDALPILTEQLRQIVGELHARFKCDGDALVSCLRALGSRLNADMKVIAERLSMLVLLVARRLLDVGSPVVPAKVGHLLTGLVNAAEHFLSCEFKSETIPKSLV